MKKYRYVVAAVLVLALLTAVILSQQSQSETVLVVQSIRIVSPDGEVRGELSVDANGNGTLRLFDQSGEEVWSAPPKAKIVPLN